VQSERQKFVRYLRRIPTTLTYTTSNGSGANSHETSPKTHGGIVWGNTSFETEKEGPVHRSEKRGKKSRRGNSLKRTSIRGKLVKEYCTARGEKEKQRKTIGGEAITGKHCRITRQDGSKRTRGKKRVKGTREGSVKTECEA